MLLFALKILISKLYDASMFWKLSDSFQGYTLYGVIFVRDWDFTKRRTLPMVYYILGIFEMDDLWKLPPNSLGPLLLTYFNFSL